MSEASNKPQVVIVHPLVLLAVVDHYGRSTLNSADKRVVGALLGERKANGVIDVCNCYAIPFEEDPNDPNIWYLDHIYNETLVQMYQKISINENIVGWYTTGTRFKPNDIQINRVFQKYTPNPILVVIDVHQHDQINLPTEAYVAMDEVTKSGEIIQNFHHLPSTVQAFEPEEIGVEQLLREINTRSGQSLTTIVQQKIQSLQGMVKRVGQIKSYLNNVVQGKIPANPIIINQLQEILNLLPNLVSDDVIQVFSTKNNDDMNTIYIATLVRSVIALHDLINNQIANKEQEKSTEKQTLQKKDEKNEKKDKEVEDKKDGAEKQTEKDKTDKH